MGSNNISAKEQIIKFKDYADIADASYAMLHWSRKKWARQ